MRIKIIIAGLALSVLGGAAFFGVKAWRGQVVARQERQAFVKAQELIRAGQPDKALAICYAEAQPGGRCDWRPVELDALVGLRDVGRLAPLYERESARVLQHEEASVLLARAFLHARQAAKFEQVRTAWRGHEKQPQLWLALDSDALLLAGKPREAEKWLRTQKLPGKADAVRLGRLALLVGKRDLNEAWQLLDQASQLDSHNVDLRSFRAQLLEGIKRPEAALVENVAALVAEPKNQILRDQLAEFYRRQGQYDLALQTWQEGLTAPSVDFIWLKLAFWGRMIQPVALDADKVPPGEIEPLAQWVIRLQSGQFWQSNSFAALPQARRYAQERQELFWLQLLDLLHNRREAEAQEMLKFNRFRTRSWQPDLEAAVRRILIYRQARSLNAADLVFVSTTPATNQHQFFVQLESLAKQERSVAQFRFPPEFDALLRGPEAFAAAFLAAGWREAALQLYAGTDLSQRPDWLAYGLGQLLRMNRGNRAALTFLDKQKPSPSLGLLSAEILIGDGKAAEGLKRLATLASENSPVGFRASYMLALASLDAGKYDDARGWVSRQPLLVKEIVGVELLARIALRQGQAAEADRLYRTVAKDSIEAKSYLARQAFAQKNWAEARRYTMELIHALPDELTLRENLLAIDKAAATP